MTAPDLSALVAARLCHDLISPMGAIGNGLELLQLANGAAGPELALVHDSLKTALAKLRFYRIAFGPADPQGRQSFDEAAQITDAMFHGRLMVAWDPQGSDMSRPVARLIYLAVLCLEKSLPLGGVVRIAAGGPTATLSVEGHRTAPPPELWAHVLTGAPLPDLRPEGVQFALLRQALAATDHRIEAGFTDTEASMRIAAETAMLAEARP